MKMIVRYFTISLIFLFNNLIIVTAGKFSPVNDLPLQLSGSKGNHEVLMIYLTGDGGWNSFNQQLVKEFEKLGYGVVTLNTRKYFWNEKSPEVFASDIEQLSGYFMKEWEKSSLIIVGYSFGADVASFLSSRISAELHKKIKKIVLLSPSGSTDFVIRVSDLIGESENVNRKFKVRPEIEKTDLPLICIFGTEETMTLKTSLEKKGNLNIYEVPGDHRYNNDLVLLSKMIGL